MPTSIGRISQASIRFWSRALRTVRSGTPTPIRRAVFFSRRGYVFVFQDVSGRHESEGKWEPFRNDIEDGYDTIEWAANSRGRTGRSAMQAARIWATCNGAPRWQTRRTWCHLPDGRLHQPLSRLDHAQWRLAAVVQFRMGPGAAGVAHHAEHRPAYTEGGPDRDQLTTRFLRHLPLIGMQELPGRNAQFYKDWIAHPDYDDYWKKINAEEVFDQIGIPVHTIGGWFDIFSQGTLDGYAGMSKKARRRLA